MATASSPDALLQELALPPFRPRPPWWGPDLQTLRDSLRGILLNPLPGNLPGNLPHNLPGDLPGALRDDLRDNSTDNSTDNSPDILRGPLRSGPRRGLRGGLSAGLGGSGPGADGCGSPGGTARRHGRRPSLASGPGRRPVEGQAIAIAIGPDAALLAQLDLALQGPSRALVLICHGLGGSSQSEGPRRLAMALRQEGMAVLRLNLRGAGAGRPLAPGSYAADCSRDLLPVLRQARILAGELGSAGRPLPLAGAGLSLGGTILLNATATALRQGQPGLDALVCISSPLDLAACALAFERPRNHLYQRWLVRRLRQQVLADPHGLSTALRQNLSGRQRPRSIRTFDALITAPRWGYGSVDDYYAAANPLRWLSSALPLPATLLLHAADDPWVPAEAVRRLQQLQRQPGADLPAGLEICLPDHGGHNGFHGSADSADSASGCWSDRLCARWLRHRLGTAMPDADRWPR